MITMRARARRALLGGRRDQGSIVVAMTMVVVLSMLAIALLARVLSGIAVGHQQMRFAAALGQADAGLSDALFQIDQQGGPVSSFCAGAPECAVPQVPSAPDVEYSVTEQTTDGVPDPNLFQVKSRGAVGGVAHAISATVARQVAYPYAIFGSSSLTFNGDGENTAVTGSDVGSDGTIDCHGGGQDGNHQVTYGGGGEEGCPAPLVGSGTYQPQAPVQSCPAPASTPPTPCMPAGALPCPVGGIFTGTVAPGAYYCPEAVVFAQTMTVGAGSSDGDGDEGNTVTDDGDADDGVQVYVFPPAGTSPAVELSGSTDNAGGDPTMLRLYVAGNGAIDPGTGSFAASFTGLIYAPDASMTVNGGSLSLDGAIVVNQFTVNGNPNLSVTYDARIDRLVQQDWTVSNYTEIPAATCACPH